MVRETAKLLVTLSEELVITARELANIPSEERGQESHQLAVENAEILRRDWASKVWVTIFTKIINHLLFIIIRCSCSQHT